MKTPDDKTIIFTYMSHPLRDAELRWVARLTFPPGAEAETPLPLLVENGCGEPVAHGIFEFAGLRLTVIDGRATLTYAEFIAGKHATAIWLHRPDRMPVPGGLTFA